MDKGITSKTVEIYRKRGNSTCKLKKTNKLGSPVLLRLWSTPCCNLKNRMEIKDENNLCDIMWQFDLSNKQKKNNTFLLFVPSEQKPHLGGNVINLITASIFFFPQMLIYLTMQQEMMPHFNENTKKSKPRCYFLSSVVLCIFLVCVVWMKGNLWW